MSTHHATGDLPSTAAWQTLQTLASRAARQPLAGRFDAEPERARHYSGALGPLFVDYAKHHLDETILAALTALADESGLMDKLAALRNGEAVNNTEARSANYPLLRRSGCGDAGEDAALDAMYRTMDTMVSAVHGGNWRGASGQTFSDVVNIGIGGSDFGPRLLCDALDNQGIGKLRAHFAANIDPSVISGIFKTVPAESTLFLVASKSFSTQETLANMQAAKHWLQAQLPGRDIRGHFIAITSNTEAACQSGIDPERVLAVPEWVGGRFSLWSGFGLAAALFAGMDSFRAFLGGARAVDEHCATTPLEKNIPLLLGLLDVWYRNFWGYSSQAILPYEHHLKLLPIYLQQLFMESAGKSVSRGGDSLGLATGNVIWGTEGTNGQHSFHQLLHQGSDAIPCDFITALQSWNPIDQQHQALVANCFSQSLVLMRGHSASDIERDLLAQGMAADEAKTLARHKAMLGNRPSTTILMDKLTPEALGALIALYEYRLFTASFVWNINPFDQWGVERGKQISRTLMSALEQGAEAGTDSSTAQLIARYRESKDKK